MKYLAIFKDSFREALDTKVLYVMFGLSALVILFVSTMSFELVSAEKTMEQVVKGQVHFSLKVLKPEELKAKRQDNGRPKEFMDLFEIKDFPLFKFHGVKLLRGEQDSPASDYVLLVSQSFGTKVRADGIRAEPTKILADAHQLFAAVEDLDLIHVAGARLASDAPEWQEHMQDAPGRVFVEIELHGTPGTRRLWAAVPTLFFGSVPIGDRQAGIGVPLGFQLYIFSSYVISIGSWVALLTGVIITAFFIPNMLRKGTIDLLLVKPINRWGLLLYKYIGGLTFIFLNTAFAVVGIWLVLGLRTGIWANSFLLIIFVITFFFAILYAVSTLLAVLTRSVIVSILVTCLAWFFFFLVGFGYSYFDQRGRQEAAGVIPANQHIADGTFAQVVKGVHFILPRTSDLNYLSTVLLYSDFMTGSLAKTANLDSSSFQWGESLGVSLAFLGVMLGLACWRFATRDY